MHRAVIQFAINEDEMPSFDYAGPRVVGPGKYLLLQAPMGGDWQPIPGGEPTLELYLDPTEDLDQARRDAERLYAAMRAASHLAPQAPRILGTFLQGGHEPVSSHFVDEAYEMLDQQRFEWAVVAAQIACEVEIRAAIETSADAESGTLARLAIDFPNGYSLMDSRACAVFAAVLGTRPTQAPCWSKYQRHVQRRNNVVHRGARVTRDDASASIDAMHDMLDFISRLTGRAHHS